MTQTSYSETLDVAIAGMQCNTGNQPAGIFTYTNPDSAIPYGHGVVKKSGTDGACKLPATSGDYFLGVALYNAASSDGEYVANSPVAVMGHGTAWVVVDEDVTADDAVCVRYAGKVQVQTFVVDADIITDNVITVKVNGETVTHTYASDHLTSMTAFAAKLAATSPITTAAVGGGGNRTITITASSADLDVTLTDAAITLGVTQADITIAETIASVATSKIGQFGNDTDSSTRVAVANTKFLTSASAGGLAKLLIRQA